MTTDDAKTEQNLETLNHNLAKIEKLSQRLTAALANKKQFDHGLHAPGHDLFVKASAAYMNECLANPSKIIEQQVAFWGKSLAQFVEAQNALVAGCVETEVDESTDDKRFCNPLWQTHPYFSYVKKQYLMNAKAVEEAVAGLEGLDEKDKKRAEYFSNQILDMFSPTNFLSTNPDALTLAMETDGQSLVDGLENFVRDIEANKGDLLITLADQEAFQVGKNLATTEGSVVFRNRMLELIQYKPSTAKVHTIPILIFPPWINKFYILDLKEKNSLIKWLVDQGHSVFVVSWVNPDSSYRDVGMDDYVNDGYLEAIEQVKQITDQKKVNLVGYCIAGTTLSLTLALMKKRGNKSANSATFLTTLTDFSDQGEIGVFLDNDFVDGIEREVAETGILHTFFMARTFSYLRSNDLIYGPAIRSYMMGKPPPAFDLLYWNGDGTNLPGRMAVEYLRCLCQRNELAEGQFEFLGETLSLDDIKIPLCAIACETDHIADWRSSYTGVQKMGSKDKTFILSQSGHIAGIINPPSKKKYGHYTNQNLDQSQDDWMANADFNEGSWWPRWDAWLKKRSGAKIDARDPGDSDHPVLGPAPGTYVLAVPKD